MKGESTTLPLTPVLKLEQSSVAPRCPFVLDRCLSLVGGSP